MLSGSRQFDAQKGNQPEERPRMAKGHPITQYQSNEYRHLTDVNFPALPSQKKKKRIFFPPFSRNGQHLKNDGKTAAEIHQGGGGQKVR